MSSKQITMDGAFRAGYLSVASKEHKAMLKRLGCNMMSATNPFDPRTKEHEEWQEEFEWGVSQGRTIDCEVLG